MDTDYLSVKSYVLTFRAERYRVQLANKERPELVAINVAYTPDQLIRSVSFLREKNQYGYNIYARPLGYRYVLIDDLKREALPGLALVKPCLLMETSPANYQAFLMLEEEPESREQAISLCRELCQQYGGDNGSAEPDHPGRLPGFDNMKKKYLTPDGQRPKVILHRCERRITTYLPQGGACAKETLPKNTVHSNKEHDRSAEDFNNVCILIRQKKTDDYIFDVLMEKSEKAQQRGPAYVELTIRNARKLLGIYH